MSTVVTIILILVVSYLWVDTKTALATNTTTEGGQVSSDGTPQSVPNITIGIDIGTSYVRVGVFQSGRVEILKNEQGVELTPSYVAFTSSGRRLIGDEAKSQQTANPRNTVFSVFPLMGRTFDDPVVQNHIKQIPYRVYSRSNTPAINVQIGERTETFAPEEFVAMLLRRMKEIAESYLNVTVTNAVVSIPSCFCYSQRRAMRDAGKIAGLEEIYIVNSPVAAAIAYYGADSSDKRSETRILVVDLGGSSFGASVISFSDGAIGTEAQGSICDVSGERFEERVMEHMMNLLENQMGMTMAERLTKSSLAVQKLRREVEKAIRQLSFSERASVQVESLIGGEDFTAPLTRSTFSKLIMDLLRQAKKLVESVLKEAEVSGDDLHDIVLVGGFSHTAVMRQVLKNVLSGREPSFSMDPHVSSVLGAAIHAATLDGHEPTGKLAILTVCPQTFGYGVVGGNLVAMLNKNELLPTTNSHSAVIVADDKNSAVTNAAVRVYEGAASKVKDANFVGSVTIDFPPTVLPDVWISFRMKKFYILEVSIVEMKTGEEATVIFEHGLSELGRKNLRRRLRNLSDLDRMESQRLAARDGLESLAHLMQRRTQQGDLAMTKSAALTALEWLEANAQADAEEFVMKRRELALAAQSIQKVEL